MADDQTPTEPNPNASQPGAAAPAAFDPSTLPPEAIAWFEAERRKASDAAAAAARRAEQEKAKPRSAPNPTPPASPPAADDVTAILAMRDAFDDAVGDLPIKSQQKALMREAVMRDRPADVAGYVARFTERAGWNTAGQPAPQPAAPASSTPVTPQAPAVPATHRAPPPPAPVFTENTPLLSIATSGNFAAIEKLADDLGVDKFVERLLLEAKRTRVPLT